MGESRRSKRLMQRWYSGSSCMREQLAAVTAVSDGGETANG